MVQLRDGKKLIGVLRSWDQFGAQYSARDVQARRAINRRAGNLVLQDTVLRHFCQGLYGDEPRGLQLIRGENILLMGEIDLDREDNIPAGWREVPWQEVKGLEKEEEDIRKKGDVVTLKKLKKHGFEGEHSGETIF